MKSQNVLVIFQWLIIIGLVFFLVRSCNQREVIYESTVITNPDSLNLAPELVIDSSGSQRIYELEGQNTQYRVLVERLKKELLTKPKNSKEQFVNVRPDRDYEKLLNRLSEKEKENKNFQDKIRQLINVNAALEIDAKSKAIERIVIDNSGNEQKMYSSMWRDEDGWATIGTVFNKELREFSHSLNVKSSMSILQYEKGDEMIVEITDENPYIMIDKGTNVFAFPKPKEKIKRWSLGIQGGYYLTNRLELRPAIGIGLNYSLLSF